MAGEDEFAKNVFNSINFLNEEDNSTTNINTIEHNDKYPETKENKILLRSQYRESKKELINKANELKKQIKKVEDELHLREKNTYGNKNEKFFKQVCNESLKYYSSNFNFDVNIKDMNDENYTAEIKKVKDDNIYSILIKLDRQNHNVIDFNAEFLTPEQKDELHQKYVVEKNYLPGLFLHLRKIIFNTE